MKQTYFRRGLVKKIVTAILVMLAGAAVCCVIVVMQNRLALEYEAKLDESRLMLSEYEEKLEETMECLERQAGYDYVNAIDDGIPRQYYRCAMFTLPDNAADGKYYDVRIVYPNGTSYVCLAAKQVRYLGPDRDVFSLLLSEEELMLLYSASVDTELYPGSRLEVTEYVGDSEVSIVNYTPNEQVITLLLNDPNIRTVSTGYTSYTVRKQLEATLVEYRQTLGEVRYD